MADISPVYDAPIQAEVGSISPIADESLVCIPSSISPINDESLVSIPSSISPIADESLVCIPSSISPIYESILFPPDPPPLLRLDQTRTSLLGILRAADMNTTVDQPIVLGLSRYVIRRVVVCGASVSLTTAVGGIYTRPGKGGTALVPANQAYSSLTSTTKFLDTALHASTSTDTIVGGTAYLSLSTPQGTTATADIYIYGDSVES